MLVGLFLAGLFCTQFISSTEAKKNSNLIQVISGQTIGENAPEVLRKLERLAKTDHIALLEFCLKNYHDRYNDYTCTLIKRERIAGVWGKEQHIAVRFLDKPFSVAMKWLSNAPIGDRVLYVEGKYGGNMLVRPKSPILRALVGGVVRREPSGRDVMKTTLRPVNMFGFERGLRSLLKIYRLADKNGDLKEVFGEYGQLAGRKVIILERYLPAKKEYPAKKTVICIDVEYLLPICIEGYNWDDQPTSRYVYKDVRLNIGLSPDDFLPEANDMKSPK